VISIAKPLNIFPLVPYTFSLFSILLNKSTFAMLFSVFPLSIIYTVVFPVKDALALSFVKLKRPYVGLTILPAEIALTVHFIL
jgi:hypothetical protein